METDNHNKEKYIKINQTYTLKSSDSILTELGYDDFSKVLVGPNALAFGKDPVAPARVLAKFAKDHEKLVLKTGIVDGKMVDEDVIKQSYLATIPSHNSTDAIKSSKIIALIIFYARNGLSKQEIIEKLNLKIQKPIVKKFNYTCSDTIDLCLYSLFTSNSFEESIKLAISFGGDTDTNACIVGSMAEAMYGISEDLKQKAVEFMEKQRHKHQ